MCLAHAIFKVSHISFSHVWEFTKVLETRIIVGKIWSSISCRILDLSKFMHAENYYLFR